LQDELFADALDHVGQGEVRQTLTLELLLGDLLHAGHGDLVAGEGEAAVPVRIDRGVGIACDIGALEDAGDQGDDHGDDGRADDHDEDGFDEAIVFALQETNHGRLTTFGDGRLPQAGLRVTSGPCGGRTSPTEILCSLRL